MNVSLKTGLALLLVMVVVFIGCENPAGAGSDPNTLLPAGTIQGWVGASHASGDWHLDWFGLWSSTEGNQYSDFGKISLLSAAYPGQTIPLSEVEGRLRSSSDRGGDRFVFDNSYPAGFITPQVDMLRVVGLYNSEIDYSISRADTGIYDDQTNRIEWWYASADTVVNGTRNSPAGFNEIANNVSLSTGWNMIIFTKTGTDWTITTGTEPLGLGWHILSFD